MTAQRTPTLSVATSAPDVLFYLPRIARFVGAADQPVGQDSSRPERVREGLLVDPGPAPWTIRLQPHPELSAVGLGDVKERVHVAKAGGGGEEEWDPGAWRPKGGQVAEDCSMTWLPSAEGARLPHLARLCFRS